MVFLGPTDAFAHAEQGPPPPVASMQREPSLYVERRGRQFIKTRRFCQSSIREDSECMQMCRSLLSTGRGSGSGAFASAPTPLKGNLGSCVSAANSGKYLQFCIVSAGWGIRGVVREGWVTHIGDFIFFVRWKIGWRATLSRVKRDPRIADMVDSLGESVIRSSEG